MQPSQLTENFSLGCDTALLAGTSTRAEQLLHTLQRIASHSNLHLNLKKCVLLRSPTSHNPITFTDGTPAARQVPWRHPQQRRLHPQRHHDTPR